MQVPPEPEPSEAEDDARAVFEAIRHLLRTLRDFSALSETKVGLSGAQLFALQTVARHGPIGVSRLAELTLTHQSSVSVVARKLVERGLCEKRSSPDDGRRVVLVVSRAGRALLRRSPPVIQDHWISTIMEIPEQDRRSLARLLTSLVRRLDAGEGAAPMFFETTPKRQGRADPPKRAQKPRAK